MDSFLTIRLYQIKEKLNQNVPNFEKEHKTCIHYNAIIAHSRFPEGEFTKLELRNKKFMPMNIPTY